MATTTDVQRELSRVEREIEQCRAAMQYPKIGAVAMRRLYNQLWSLYRQRAALEKAIADHDHTASSTQRAND